MGVATTTISTRPAAAPNVAQTISTGNNTFNAMIEAGMIPVDHADYTGQTEKFVDTATSNLHETVVPVVTSSTNGRILIGYRVFRHPYKNYYIKIDIGYEANSDNVNPTQGTRIYVNFTLGLGLNGTGGFNGTPLNLIVKNNVFVPSPSYMPNGTNGKILTLRISVGVDYFTCCASYDHFGYSPSYCNRNTGHSSIALAIIGSKANPRYSIIFIPRTGGWNESYFEEASIGAMTENDCQLQRKYLLDLHANSITYLGASQTVNAMTEVGLVSDKNGVRVTQAYVTVDGELLPLEMGCIHAGATTDMGLLTVDLDGNGPKQYYSPFGLGYCNWIPYNQPIERIPVFLLPYY